MKDKKVLPAASIVGAAIIGAGAASADSTNLVEKSKESLLRKVAPSSLSVCSSANKRYMLGSGFEASEEPVTQNYVNFFWDGGWYVGGGHVQGLDGEKEIETDIWAGKTISLKGLGLPMKASAGAMWWGNYGGVFEGLPADKVINAGLSAEGPYNTSLSASVIYFAGGNFEGTVLCQAGASYPITLTENLTLTPCLSTGWLNPEGKSGKTTRVTGKASLDYKISENLSIGASISHQEGTGHGRKDETYGGAHVNFSSLLK